MEKLCIHYASKEALDREQARENKPFFQLAKSTHVSGSNVISRSEDYPSLALDVLQYLKKPTSLRPYGLVFSQEALAQIGTTEKKVLEEILSLHNDLVTPRRT